MAGAKGVSLSLEEHTVQHCHGWDSSKTWSHRVPKERAQEHLPTVDLGQR